MYAQEGGYFLSHHTPNGDFDNVNFDLIQDKNGIVHVANRAGIITFDGKHWRFQQTPSAIFSLYNDPSDGTIYSSGRNGFGRLDRDQFYNLVYQKISDSTLVNSDIFSLLAHENKLYGIGQEVLFIHDLEQNTLTRIKPKFGGYLSSLFVINQAVYVTNSVSGILEYKNGSLIDPSISILKGIFPDAVEASKSEQTWVMEVADSLVLFNGQKFEEIQLGQEDRLYLAQSEIQQIKWLQEDLLAISTLKGGIIFLNPQNGKFLQVLDNESGLPDAEIYAIEKDRDGNLWIAHRQGFTRVSPTSPFRSYSEYPGLKGEILSAVRHLDTLYVGTTDGLFYLETVKDYDEITYYVDKQVMVESDQQEAKETVEGKPRRRGLLGFLRKKGDRKDVTSDSLSRPGPGGIVKTIRQRQTRKQLHSVRYEYKQVLGINSKVVRLTSKGGRLFSAGLDGLYEIKKKKGFPILLEPVRAFHYSEQYNTVFVGTFEDEIKVFDLNVQSRELYLFGEYANYTTHIFEDPLGRVWFCGTNKIFWITLDSGEIGEAGEYRFDNPFFYETYGAANGNKVAFINEGGIYEFSGTKVERIGEGMKFLLGANGNIWTLQENGWGLLEEGEAKKNFELLRVFKDTKYLAQDGESVWLITENTLLLLSPQIGLGISSSYDLILRGIKTDHENIGPSGKLRLDLDKSALLLEFIKPDFSGIANIEYQYILEGLPDSKWTDWSVDYSTINFPYLPEGDYDLSVRSRDAFGNISDTKKLSFKVVPPYWKRPWFYALEFTALGLILLISLRIKRLGYRYRLGSRLLALLALIIIIEFIQTVAENEFQTKSSAVFDFAIQVLMAILILPLEGLLRKYIFKEKNVQLTDFIRIRDKKTKIDEN